MEQGKILAEVREVLRKALGVDEDEIEENSKLVEDLGAESVDFLDIVFRLEHKFKISIPRQELFPLFPEDFFDKIENNEDGRLTDDGLLVLKRLFPDLDLSQFTKDPQVSRINSLFTVKYLVDYTARKIPSVDD